MDRILSKTECSMRIDAYYREQFGQRHTDRWYDTTAVNVKVFARDGELISLKCHILTGVVTATTEKM